MQDSSKKALSIIGICAGTGLLSSQYLDLDTSCLVTLAMTVIALMLLTPYSEPPPEP